MKVKEGETKAKTRRSEERAYCVRRRGARSVVISARGQHVRALADITGHRDRIGRCTAERPRGPRPPRLVRYAYIGRRVLSLLAILPFN